MIRGSFFFSMLFRVFTKRVGSCHCIHMEFPVLLHKRCIFKTQWTAPFFCGPVQLAARNTDPNNGQAHDSNKLPTKKLLVMHQQIVTISALNTKEIYTQLVIERLVRSHYLFKAQNTTSLFIFFWADSKLFCGFFWSTRLVHIFQSMVGIHAHTHNAHEQCRLLSTFLSVNIVPDYCRELHATASAAKNKNLGYHQVWTVQPTWKLSHCIFVLRPVFMLRRHRQLVWKWGWRWHQSHYSRGFVRLLSVSEEYGCLLFWYTHWFTSVNVSNLSAYSFGQISAYTFQ